MLSFGSNYLAKKFAISTGICVCVSSVDPNKPVSSQQIILETMANKLGAHPVPLIAGVQGAWTNIRINMESHIMKVFSQV